MGTGNIIFPI